MRIVHLLAGAGGMYCGSCLQGNTLAAALAEAGEEVLLAPVYTPIRTDEEDVSIGRVAFGGINVYLQQHSALFRHTPWFFDRLLDHPALLRWLAKRAVSTRPGTLGPLAVSMLRGEQGRQRKEVEKLVRWLAAEVQPEVVHLSNVLLAGMARQISRRLGVPVVSSLSGEDSFLEAVPEPYYSEARAVLRERCNELAALVAMSRDYADFMAGYLAVPRERIHVIPPGLNLAGHGVRLRAQESETFQEPDGPSGRPLVIGYLSRIAPEKGLHQLAEAFKLLCDQADLPPLRLAAAGYLDPADRPYLERIASQLRRWGLSDRFAYAGELDRAGKIAFLGAVDVLGVPTSLRESKGLAVLEAWASGVPVVVPDRGCFRELVEDTGGGLLHQPESPPSLASALRRMLLDRSLARQCGRNAQQAVRDRYHARLAAQRTIALYGKLLGR